MLHAQATAAIAQAKIALIIFIQLLSYPAIYGFRKIKYEVEIK